MKKMRLLFSFIWKPFFHSYFWVKATSLASKGKFQRSMMYVENLEKLGLVKYKVLIFKSFLLFSLGKSRECCDTLDVAYPLIEKSNESPETRAYIKAYVLFLYDMALGKRENSKFLKQRFRAYSLVDLRKISKTWTQNFPLPEHPEWSNYNDN